MTRANRHYQSGHVWHLTHRCHDRQWLLRFARDRDRWLFWLHQAVVRHGLVVLNFIVTSNHIHLLVEDQGKGEIWRAMQLVAARTAQEFNRRKGRGGSFWQDRYHATAVETDAHLLECVRYIDLNMARAGVVDHPCQWRHSGFVETLRPVTRYRRLDLQRLGELWGCEDLATLQRRRLSWVEQALAAGGLQRQAEWTKSLAVGSKAFLQSYQSDVRARHPRTQIRQGEGVLFLRERREAYR